MKIFIYLLALSASSIARPQEQDEFFDPNPQYQFSYKVASDLTQTYINQDESRDGNFVTGEYSYVDPYGSLITVVYEAGPEGYSETRTVQEGFLTINPENAGAGSSSVIQTKPVPTRNPSFDEDNIIRKIVGGLTPLIEETVAEGLEN
ncbi:unnamed protein product [Lepeophtheirus salmonis]|uniref:(salmon louse) hypothetical protein n=1 Tax=Lepeophtheirus salmonis TaxID=72036 RepID=A0A7R8D2A1_LEPSM|nr:unnamed protein product [Lepeophtheirus salmonis]CAF2955468.1 unnamed protein product [Lepeophtheirus salmonis]